MRLILALNSLFVGAVIFAIPNMTRRGILFAVPVAGEFRETETARRSIASFRALVGCVVLAGACGLLLAPETAVGPLAVAAPLVILLAGVLGFYCQNRSLKRFSVQQSLRPREAHLIDGGDRLPWFSWLGAGPFAIIASVSVFLKLNWENIPSRFPVHWDAAGQPNRWSERTAHGVYGPLLFAVELCVWLLIMAMAGWFGARRSRFRRIMLGAMVAVENMLGLVFAGISAAPLLHIPMWVLVFGPMLFIIPMLIIMARSISEPSEIATEATPNECWKGSVIYYNPDDAALFVEKRTGLGYTFNFGNRWSWALILGLGLVVGSAFVLF